MESKICNNKITNNKFSKLNWNLKNEIFRFMPIVNRINILMKISKSFKYANDHDIRIIKIKSISKNYIHKIDFLRPQSLDRIKEEIKNEEIDNILYDDLMNFFIAQKYKNQEKLQIKEVSLFKLVEILKLFFQFITQSLNIIELDISYNFLLRNKQAFSLFEKMILDNRNISILNFSMNSLGDDIKGFERFKEILINKNSIKDLNLEYNKIGNSFETMIILKEIITNCTNLKRLNISNNYIGESDDAMEELEKMFKNNKNITHLNLSKNYIKLNGILYICNFLRHNESLMELNFNDNLDSFQFEVFVILINKIKKYKNKKDINIINNDILSNKEKMGNLVENCETLSNIVREDTLIDSFKIAGIEKSFKMIYSEIRLNVLQNQ